MTLAETYAARLAAAILAVDPNSVAEAATIVAEQLRRDGLVYVYGPGGHSALAVQDVFYRAGCPVNIAPVVDADTMLLGGALRSTAVERTPGHGAEVVARCGVGPGDPFIVVNAFGVNAAALSAARAARERGARVIALSSRAATSAVPADHPARAGADLSELADVHVDTLVPAGDTVLATGGVHLGGMSTVMNSFVLQAILASAMERLLADGEEAWVWRSSYTVGGDAHNARAATRVRDRVPQL